MAMAFLKGRLRLAYWDIGCRYRRVYWTRTGFAMNPARDLVPNCSHGWRGGEHGDERWARSLILSCRLSRLLSAPVPEQPYIAILLVEYLVTARTVEKWEQIYSNDVS